MDTRCEYSTLTLPNDVKYLDVATAYVGEVAAKLGFDSADRASIERAVREAASNVITHAFEPAESAGFEIACERVPVGLRVSVKDKGVPFDPATVPECELPTAPGLDPAPGCGILSMKESVDELHFNNLGPNGKETVLIKYLKSRNISEYFEACELGAYADDRVDVPRAPRSTEITIRPLEPADAIEVSRCVYRAYGYDYVYEDVYYPDRLIQLNESGDIFSAVAVTRDNEIVGHGALISYEHGPLAETGIGVVKPEFRSLGILTRLETYLVEKAKSQGLLGIFGRPVTTHTYTQQVGERFQLRNCAVLVGNMPQPERFRGISGKLSQRETLLVHFKYLAPPRPVELFAPRHHADMIRDIYDQFTEYRDMRSFRDASVEPRERESVIRTKLPKLTGTARIDIESYGKDPVSQLNAVVRELCLKRVDVIHLYLNLCDPLTATFTKRFEELGFFFAGILPLGMPQDALILQYLNNVPIDYSKIRVHSERTRTLLEYVKGHDPNAV
ncbi:MAG: GNAT family N-acetyltransferase [Desulfomonilaceae bacterium]|nr:GNAT family N-acetyltransferase [Desulfomonilaceae bacterium]